MTTPIGDLRAVARSYRRAEKTFDERRRQLVAEIMRATDGGHLQVDIANATGLSRESIRKIVKKVRDQAHDPSSDTSR